MNTEQAHNIPVKSAVDKYKIATDAELIALFHQQPNRKKFICGLLFERHQAKIHAQALRLLHNTDDARDVVQLVGLKLFLNIGKFQAKSLFSTWLYRIVFNESISFLQKNTAYDELPEKYAEQVDDFTDHLIDERAISLSLKYLNEPDRQILQLRFYQDCKLREIALILHISLSAVKMRLMRALERLLIVFQSQTGIHSTIR